MVPKAPGAVVLWEKRWPDGLQRHRLGNVDIFSRRSMARRNLARHSGSVRDGMGPAGLAARVRRLDRGAETDRTVFFSDAVFAIAMTLLVLDLKLPEMAQGIAAADLGKQLLEQAGPMASFVLSFVLVGRLWMNHHRKFTAIKGYDGRLQAINLTALFFVVFLPVPTSLLFQADSESPWPPVIYAITISGAFLSLAWLWHHAHAAGLMHDWVEGPLFRYVLHGTDPVWAVFVLSIPLAFISPVWAMYFWILIWPVSVVHGRWQLARGHRLKP